jgi:hypothetical protein
MHVQYENNLGFEGTKIFGGALEKMQKLKALYYVSVSVRGG